jgi:hypothetical protein
VTTVFDANGNLTFAHAEASSDDRPPAADVMAALRRATKASASAAEV